MAGGQQRNSLSHKLLTENYHCWINTMSYKKQRNTNGFQICFITFSKIFRFFL